MKKTLAGALALGLLVFAGSALGLGGAASFTDVAGDDNAAPDITSVSIIDSSASSITLGVASPNYPTLKIGSWFNLYFDLDANPQTGIIGGEALVRYVDDGDGAAIQRFEADGFRWLPRSTAGLTATYQSGQLTMTIPRASLGAADPLGVLVISGRRQPMGAAVYIASDWAPNQGNLSWSGTATASHADPASDHEAAPDITSVRVSDTAKGWIRFAITTPNYKQLRAEDTLVAVLVDADYRKGTGQVGADYAIGHIDGEVYLDRWSKAQRRWVNVPGRPLVRTKNTNNVVTIEVHRSELGDIRKFDFRLASAVLHFPSGLTFGVDQAPDIRSTFWGYRLANKPALRLLAGRAVGTPARPRAGARFTINVPLKRSDTNRSITSGTVKCSVRVAGRSIRATGRVHAGRGQCTLVVPRIGERVNGTMTVHSAGEATTSRFSFRIRR